MIQCIFEIGTVRMYSAHLNSFRFLLCTMKSTSSGDFNAQNSIKQQVSLRFTSTDRSTRNQPPNGISVPNIQSVNAEKIDAISVHGLRVTASVGSLSARAIRRAAFFCITSSGTSFLNLIHAPLLLFTKL
uniref:Uncharacterized protein n=1 Tax=Skeletonema marinoi TaxID=267567 RepID=A0A7S2PX23_9STRA